MSYDQLLFDEDSRELAPLMNYTPDESFDPSTYEVSKAIQDIHDYPRFGHPNNFEDLINSIGSGDSDATSASAKQYVTG